MIQCWAVLVQGRLDRGGRCRRAMRVAYDLLHTCSFGLLSHSRSRTGAQTNGLLGAAGGPIPSTGWSWPKEFMGSWPR
jgi:hypothetical protein